MKKEELLFRYVCEVCLLVLEYGPPVKVIYTALNTNTHERETWDEMYKKDSVIERLEEAVSQKVREEATDAYYSCNMRFDRHWSNKRLEEISEKDWHTFREDFNISYEGSRIPHSLRSWE
ncbi:hypothetical protein Rs2_40075 [Raphanus sativus]|nr:hypothetical protein Rs2_40075 [Raphanus sativus]